MLLKPWINEDADLTSRLQSEEVGWRMAVDDVLFDNDWWWQELVGWP